MISSATPILVALGANLPAPDGTPPAQTLARAAAALRDLAAWGMPGLRLLACSPLYATAPIPASDQPVFLNAVAALEGAADPAFLLATLHRIEAAFGRVRGLRNAARTLDLDLIGMGGLRRAAPDPVLPHPRAALRGFVLRPLQDVAPAWVHPVLGQNAAALLAALPPQQIALWGDMPPVI